jgi:hypothetical protein
MDQAGLVLAAVAGLWIVYLLPQLLRQRQQLAEARVTDRFSDRLRVLRAAEILTPAGPHVPSHGGVRLHPQGGDRVMHRPESVGDRVTADAVRLTASEHRGRAAALARRAAAARRRAVLIFLLLLASVVGWAGALELSWTPVAGLVPTVLMVGGLIASRRAVLAGRRIDAAWAAGAARRASRPRMTGSAGGSAVAVGRAAHPSEGVTEVIAKVPAGPVRRSASTRLATGPVPAVKAEPRVEARPEVKVEAPEERSTSAGPSATSPAGREPDEDASRSWVPVPVPVPSYVLKPEVRRPEPRPMTAPQPVVRDQGRGQQPAAGGRSAQAGDARLSGPTTGGLPLDELLARRRASGQ